MATVRPTKKQRVLLDFIGQFIAEHGYSPSYREIVNGCGYNSIATVAVHINNLISRGHLRKRDHSARSLELTASAVEEATALSDTDSMADRKAEEWLMRKIESRLEVIEAKTEISADDLYVAQVLMTASDILDMAAATEKLTSRIKRLESRCVERVQSDRKAV